MKRNHYTKELLEENVKNCYSLSELCRRLGIKPVGGNISSVRRNLDRFDVDYSHFTGQNWNSNPNNPVYINKYAPNLCEHSSLRSAYVKELVYNMGLKENKCERCGLSEWQGEPLTCELHHINGDNNDNRIENLIILCPNCHSQTHNFRGKNRKRN